MIETISLLDFKLRKGLDAILYYASQEYENKKDIKDLHYGQIWKKYLIENNKEKIMDIIMKGSLNNKIREVDKIATDYKNNTLNDLIEKNKNENITILNNIAEEMTIKNIIEKFI